MLRSCRIQQDFIAMRDDETYWSGIVTILTFHQSKEPFEIQQRLDSPDVLTAKLPAQFCQEIRAFDVFNDVSNPGYTELLVVLLPKGDEKVQDSLHKVCKGKTVPQSLNKLVSKLTQLDPF